MPLPLFEPSLYVRDRLHEGEFSVHRDIYRDPAIFELEMKHIFESTWNFVGHSSQIPKAHDFLTTWVGRQPVIVSRDKDGQLHCLLNTCRHRGATVCQRDHGNARAHTCPYHGWIYDSAGKCIRIKDDAAGHYSKQFTSESHDLVELPRIAEYRGFIFASLSDKVPPLEEHLGDARRFIDLVVDQGSNGIELIPTKCSYTYRGNWKLQIENCLDSYHLTSVHTSFMNVVERRKLGESRYGLKMQDFNTYAPSGIVAGGFTFPHGHAVLWSEVPSPEARPLFQDIEAVRARVGETDARWMLCVRNLSLFPNMQLAEAAALQLRIIRPLAPDLTEMTIHSVGPVGEGAEAREFRIRQYEDFFNSTGLATPDDTQVYEQCQIGYRALALNRQQGYHRGMLSVRKGADEYARQLGIHPETSQSGSFTIEDETVMHAAYREWLRLMEQARQ